MTTQITPSATRLIVTEIQPFTALSFSTQATLRTLSQHGHVPENMYQEADRLGLSTTGPIQYVYTGVNGDATNEFRLDIALPISQPRDQPFGFHYQEFPAFRCASYTHTGSWADLPQVYDTLFAKFYQHGYQNDGRVREVYAVVDLATPANCVTDIQIALV